MKREIVVRLERWREFGTESLHQQLTGYLYTLSVLDERTEPLDIPGLPPMSLPEQIKSYREHIEEIAAVLAERGKLPDA